MSRAAFLLPVLVLVGPVRAQLGPPSAPPQNPVTEEKRILGKLLFWEEQLSSGNTMACGTCHQFAVSGADARFARHPGPDGVYESGDDIFGTRGTRSSTGEGDYVVSEVYGIDHQVVPRSAPPSVTAAYFKSLFWDGRATKKFFDPETGQLLMTSHGALESQAVGPILSAAEMAYPNRTWEDVKQKLAEVRPMALAADLPPDMASAIASGADYPDLFEDAFGDSEITGARIAFAIATYERTLIPDQTPWDLFDAGQTSALTPAQQNGLSKFMTSARCNVCHEPPLFSNERFHNLGLRPVADDIGREAVTRDPADAGRFKTPSLRNVSLRTQLFHNGRIPEIPGAPPALGKSLVAQTMPLYILGGGPFPENVDPFLLPLPGLTDEQVRNVVDFVVNGLTDPRLAAGTFPFDSPTLFSQSRERGLVFHGSAVPGRGGRVPELVVDVAPVVDGGTFRLGLVGARPFTYAWVSVQHTTAPQPPFGAAWRSVATEHILQQPGVWTGGSATWRVEFPSDPALIGLGLDMRWNILDPAALGGVAQTRSVIVTLQ